MRGSSLSEKNVPLSAGDLPPNVKNLPLHVGDPPLSEKSVPLHVGDPPLSEKSASLARQYSPNRSWMRDSSAMAIL